MSNENDKWLKFVYSKKVDKIITENLVWADEAHRVQINEWRNFKDYDIIPIIKEVHEEWNRRVRKNGHIRYFT